MDKNPARPHRMGLIALTAMTASNMMGSGVFMLPATLAHIGSISVWGWAATFLVVLGMALIFNKTNALYPRSGGIIATIHACFGPFIGLQMTLFYWLSTWTGNCALLLASVGYLSVFFPVLHTPLYATLTSIVLLWISVFFGLRGARLVGRTQLVTGGCMILVILSVGLLGWGHFDIRLYQASWNVSGQSDRHAIVAAAVISMWGFLGIESGSVSFSQVVNPRRTIPLATLLGLSITGLCYVSSVSVIMGILPHSALESSASPFADCARLLWGTMAGRMLSAAVVIACLGAVPGWQILQTEVPRAAAGSGLLPAIFARTNRFGVPWVALLFTAGLMTLVLLMTLSANLQSQFTTIITLAITASLFPYAFSVLSLPGLMLITRYPRLTAVYAYSALSGVIFVFIAIALLSGQSQALLCGMLLQLITLPLYLFSLVRRRRLGNATPQQGGDAHLSTLTKELL
ncbi:amino acid permease [Pantoea sp. C2G6]|uniref:amino acid permease n=1 Tax=Pantoea sp. C2G6 TaxID=3243084 RepID=UPI003EDA27B0